MTTRLAEIESRLKADHWAVEVRRNGESVVCIESNCLSGREISPEDEAAIRSAAHSLLAFIGDPHPSANEEIERLEQAVQRLRGELDNANHEVTGSPEVQVRLEEITRLTQALADAKEREAALVGALKPFAQFAQIINTERAGWYHAAFPIWDDPVLTLAPFIRANKALASCAEGSMAQSPTAEREDVNADGLGFRQCSQWHWQAKIGNDLLDYWPSKSKWRFRGVTTVGDKKQLIELIRRYPRTET